MKQLNSMISVAIFRARRVLKFYFLLLAVILCLAGLCPAQAASPESSQASPGMISGTVTVSGKPAANIKVALLAADASNSNQQEFGGHVIATTPTDDAGNYSFSDLAANHYWVIPVAGTYVLAGDRNTVEQGKPVILDAGEQATGINLSLSLGGVITGKVVDGSGQPMIGQHISLEKVDEQGNVVNSWSRRSWGIETDDRGVYRAYGLAPGRYRVAAGGESLVGEPVHRARTYSPGVTDPASAATVEVGPGSESANVDISLGPGSKTYSASGRFVDGDTGNAVPFFGYSYGTKYIGRSGAADSRGEFKLEALSPGDYNIRASSDNSSPYTSDPVNFEVTDSDVTGLEIRLHQGATVSGTVTVEGNSDPSVSAQISSVPVFALVMPQSGPGMFDQVKLAQDGSFQIMGVPSGSLHFQVRPLAVGGAGFRVDRVEVNGVVSANGVEITSGQSLSGVNIILHYGSGSIHGSINITGAPLPADARLFVIASSVNGAHATPLSQTMVDSAGHFQFDALTDGDYQLVVRGVVSHAPLQLKSSTPTVTVVGGQTVNVVIDAEYQARTTSQ